MRMTQITMKINPPMTPPTIAGTFVIPICIYMYIINVWSNYNSIKLMSYVFHSIHHCN